MALSLLKTGLITGVLLATSMAYAETYKIDTKGAHASIHFKMKHLGYSWLKGRFNTFSGEFSYDENNPEKSSISLIIDTNSVDSNHAERDKHLRSDDFLDVKKYPQATFVSTSYREKENGRAVLTGNFTLHGVTKSIDIMVEPIGHGPDPWGGVRRGFEGSTQISLSDYNIMKNLGPKTKIVMLNFSLEGVKK